MTPRPNTYQSRPTSAERLALLDEISRRFATRAVPAVNAAKPVAEASPLDDRQYLDRYNSLLQRPAAERLAGIRSLNREYVLPRLTNESRQIAEKYCALADDTRQAGRFGFWQRDNARELKLTRAEVSELSTPLPSGQRMQSVLT
jgi:hypothetical protein